MSVKGRWVTTGTRRSPPPPRLHTHTLGLFLAADVTRLVAVIALSRGASLPRSADHARTAGLRLFAHCVTRRCCAVGSAVVRGRCPAFSVAPRTSRLPPQHPAPSVSTGEPRLTQGPHQYNRLGVG